MAALLTFGAEVWLFGLPDSDGYPEAWFTRNWEQTGPYQRSTSIPITIPRRPMALIRCGSPSSSAMLPVSTGLHFPTSMSSRANTAFGC